jgi:hypothetical protein
MEKKLLVVIVTAFLLFIIAFAFRKRKFVSNLLFAGAGILAMLLIIEFAYRIFLKKKDAADKISPFSLYSRDSALGYKNNQPATYNVVNSFPGGDTVYNTSYTVLNDTLISGIHFNFRKGYKSDSCEKEAVFLGCSLTFGHGLADTETLPYCYGTATNMSTVNMACIGYGIHQVYQLFNLKYSPTDNNKRIFVYPFFYDHILRANGIYGWNNAGPFFDVQHDTLVNLGPLYKFKHLNGYKWAHYASLFGTFRVIKENLHKIIYRRSGKNLLETDYRRCFIMLQEMAKKINGSGGKLIILNWGEYNWLNSPLKFMAKDKIEQNLSALSKYGAVVIPVSSIIDMTDNQNYIPADGHPSATANKAIAMWMAKNLKF